MTEAPEGFNPPLRATGHCRHYSYMRDRLDRGPTCALGLDLTGPGASRKCWPVDTSTGAGCGCDRREEYTEAERAAWGDYVAARTARMVLILPAIPGKDEGRGKAGTIPCPACDGGVVRWSRAASNGHLWAACSTPNCFSIIQ